MIKGLYEKTRKLIKGFSRVTGYKINIKNQLYFYILRKIYQKEKVRKAMTFIVA